MNEYEEIPRAESEKYSTTIIIREDLERDEDLQQMIVDEEQNELLYKTIFFSLGLLLLNLIAW